MVSLVRRYATADSRWNHALSQTSGRKPTITTSASGQSSSSMPVPTKISEKPAFSSESSPSSKSSDSESMSETWREITWPEVYRSWNATDSHWKWLKTLARSSRTTALPILPRTETNEAVAVRLDRDGREEADDHDDDRHRVVGR